MDLNAWVNNNLWWLVILWVWSIIWKAFALWRAANKNDKPWFIALMILNTAGLLEIFYLFVFSRRYQPVVEPKTEQEKTPEQK
jgi:hypothetical protein